MFFAEGAVVKDAVALFELADAGAELDDFADAHIAQGYGEVDFTPLVVEEAQCGVKAPAWAGVALE